MIRTKIRLAEAPSHGKTIFQYERYSRGARDFLDLAREALGVLAPDAREGIEGEVGPPS